MSGKRGTTIPMYSKPTCDRARSQASSPKGNAEAAQIDQVCARFGTHAASGQSGLETCALVTFRCKTDITCCTEKEVRADAGLTVSTSGAARLIHRRYPMDRSAESGASARPKPHAQLLQSKLALSATSGLISVAG